MQMQASRQIKQIIGENIAARRAERGLSRAKLGLLAGGIDAQSIYKWERGHHRPHDESLAAIAHALESDLHWFFVDHRSEAAA